MYVSVTLNNVGINYLSSLVKTHKSITTRWVLVTFLFKRKVVICSCNRKRGTPNLQQLKET